MVEQQPTRGTQIMRAMVHSALSEISKKGNEWIEVGLGNEIRVDQLDFNKPTSEFVSERIRVKPPELSEEEFQTELLKLAIRYNTPLGQNSRGVQDKLNELFEGKIGRRGRQGIQGKPGASTAEAEGFAKQAIAARNEAKGFVGQAKNAAKESLDWARISAGRADSSRKNAGRSEATANRSEEAADRAETADTLAQEAADRAETARTGAEGAKDATGRIAGEVDEKLKKLGDDITRAKTALIEETALVITEKTGRSIAEINKAGEQVTRDAAAAKGHADRAETAQEGTEEAARQTAQDKEATDRDKRNINATVAQAARDIAAGIKSVTDQVIKGAEIKGWMDGAKAEVGQNTGIVQGLAGEVTALARDVRTHAGDVRDGVGRVGAAETRIATSETNAAGSAGAAATSERNAATALADTLRANQEQERRNQEQQARNRNHMKRIIGAYVLGGAALTIAAIMALNSGHETNVVVDRSQISDQTSEKTTIVVNGTPITP